MYLNDVNTGGDISLFDDDDDPGSDAQSLFLCVFRDLTPEIEYRQAIADQCIELERANTELQRLSELKNEFLANMSHEVRTPMTAIFGHAESLLDGVAGAKEEVLDSVYTILQNGEHLLEILNDILDLSKIEAGKLSVENIPCSLFQIMANVESLMQARAEQKGL